jgi:N-acetylglucosaminyldiphosphoundecaprenol N-acetyl-beta-D-mannosaminyltransferase
MLNETTAPKVNILGTGISNVSLTETMDIFDHWILSGQKKRVCVTPVNCVLWARKNKQLRDLYNSADLCLCDGVPLIWASSLLGNRLKGRVTGLDLLPAYLERAAAKGYSMFFLGAKEGVAEQLKKISLQKYPNLIIAGTYSPPFAEKFSQEENTKMIELINHARPDILWVSLTAPKQDYWIYEFRDQIQASITIGVGGAFEVTAGLIPRAPVWMQKSGLEWLYRLIKEPKRMYKRYILEAPLFIPLVFSQWLRQRLNKYSG